MWNRLWNYTYLLCSSHQQEIYVSRFNGALQRRSRSRIPVSLSSRGGRSHIFWLRLRSCSKIFESGSGNFLIWEFDSCSDSGYNHQSNQGFPTGSTRTPWGYEIEHQGVRRSLGHRPACISLIEQYISQNFFGGTKNALTWQRGTSSKKGWEPLSPTEIYPCFHLRNDHTDSCYCRNWKVTPDPDPFFPNFWLRVRNKNAESRRSRLRIRYHLCCQAKFLTSHNVRMMVLFCWKNYQKFRTGSGSHS